jgi:hypothetical protein
MVFEEESGVCDRFVREAQAQGRLKAICEQSEEVVRQEIERITRRCVSVKYSKEGLGSFEEHRRFGLR